jgi:hemoglobin-like flavoprotein
MTPEQTALVRASFAGTAPQAEAVAAHFYAKLFALDPALRPLFRGDVAEQGQKLMAMIGTAIAGLDCLETIVPAVQALGRRHAGYGVAEDHYDTVATALLGTFEDLLGTDITPALRQAWVVAYTLLATTMKDAARQAAA